jgi:hypothetical protein
MKKLALAAAIGLVSCGCIAVGSLVLTPRGRRRIEELAPGDEVISVDPSTGAIVTTFVAATRSLKRETLLLKGEGWELRCTSDHPLYDPAAREWAPAGDWLVGNRSALLLVADSRSTPREVQVIERALDAVICELVDLSIEHELHNFVAEGILVHNKPTFRRSCDTPGSGYTQQPEGNRCTCSNGMQGEFSCDSEGKNTQCINCKSADGGP